MKPRTLLLGFLALGQFVSSQAKAGETWLETSYFVRQPAFSTRFPQPEPGWQVYAKRRLQIAPGLEGMEFLEGPEKGKVSWLVKDTVVTILGNGDVSIYPKSEGESRQWNADFVDISWIRGMEPLAEEKHEGAPVLVFARSKRGERVWVNKETLRPLALVNGRFVTLFELKGRGDFQPPEKVRNALRNREAGERKLGQFGAMPVP